MFACSNKFVDVKKMIEEDKYKAVIDREYSIEQVADAYRYVEKGEKIGNVVYNTVLVL